MAKIKVTQVKSKIGYPERQKRTLKALGLRKIGCTVEHDASPQVIGMVKKVLHLVNVEGELKADVKPVEKKAAAPKAKAEPKKEAPKKEAKASKAAPKEEKAEVVEDVVENKDTEVKE